MDERTPDATVRLRGAGVGSIAGGLGLAALSAFLPYAPASGAVIAGGLGWMVLERRRGRSERTSIGVVAIGAIGLLEAAGFGLGLGPRALAVVAVAFGVADIVIGTALHRFQPGAG